jgi:osmotically-inducible protein OsmY
MGRGAGRAVAASVLVFGLAACDQIQSLWKSEKDTSPPPVSQLQSAPKPVEEKANPIKIGETAAPAAAPKIDADKALAAKVKLALAADANLKVLAIDAGAADGVVTLWGTADTRAHRDKAAKLASEVQGVKSVKNELVIVAGS